MVLAELGREKPCRKHVGHSAGGRKGPHGVAAVALLASLGKLRHALHHSADAAAVLGLHVGAVEDCIECEELQARRLLHAFEREKLGREAPEGEHQLLAAGQHAVGVVVAEENAVAVDNGVRLLAGILGHVEHLALKSLASGIKTGVKEVDIIGYVEGKPQAPVGVNVLHSAVHRGDIRKSRCPLERNLVKFVCLHLAVGVGVTDYKRVVGRLASFDHFKLVTLVYAIIHSKYYLVNIVWQYIQYANLQIIPVLCRQNDEF